MIELTITKVGSKWWYSDEQRHRLNGPASISERGYCSYWVNNQRHRTDGPAFIGSDGSVAYWINGRPVSEYEHMFLTKATYG